MLASLRAALLAEALQLRTPSLLDPVLLPDNNDSAHVLIFILAKVKREVIPIPA